MTTNNSTIYGKAFEYACVLSLVEKLKNVRPFKVIENTSYTIAKERFEKRIGEKDQKEMLVSARAGICSVIDMEPKIIEKEKDILTISLQPDTVAKQQGDIRDILVIRKDTEWEIGLSVKHNHSALKHSRLSRTLDFGQIWLNKPCSKEYFDNIASVFDLLDEYKKKNLKWSELSKKEDEIYLPLLDYFKCELLNQDTQHDVTGDLIKYLIGSNGKDYYKLISNRDKTTTVIPFNILGTLNRSASKMNPKIKVPKIKLPTKIVDFSLKDNSKTTLILTLNNGWTISFRIHNASTYVECSLKFDVQLKGMPADIFYVNQSW